MRIPRNTGGMYHILALEHGILILLDVSSLICYGAKHQRGECVMG